MRGTFLAQVGSTFGTRLLTGALGFLGGAWVVRLLGLHGNGVYATAMVTVQIALALGSLGLGKTVTYMLGAQAFPAPHVYAGAWRLTLRVTLFVGALVLVLQGGARFLGLEFEHGLLWLSVLLGMVGVLASVGEGVLRGEGRIFVCNAGELASALVFLAGVGIAAGWGGADPRAVVAARCAAAALMVAIALRALKLRAFELRQARPDIERAMLRYGTTFVGYSVVLMLVYRCDVLLMGYFSGPAATGAYAAAATLAEAVLRIPEAVAYVFFPRAAAYARAAGKEQTDRLCRLSLAATGGVSVAVALFAPGLITLLFGAEFLPIVKTVRILLIGSVALGLGQVLASYFAAQNQQGFLMKSGMAALLVNVALCAWWIPMRGPEGAAWASVAAYATWAGLIVARYLDGRLGALRRVVVLGPADCRALWGVR